MNLKNKTTSDLLKKDKNISQNAANNIINNIDLDAWVCLVENVDYILDFIKRNATQKLFFACNEGNIFNLFEFLNYHSPDLDEFVASAFAEFCNDEIIERMFALLEDGTNQQKAYAAKFFSMVTNSGVAELLFESSKSDYKPLANNCALALGEMNDKTSFDYYVELLSSDDEWKVLNAAEFLSLYGNKDLILPMLRAMSNSTMSEYISSEIASFEKLYNLFVSENEEVQELSLECFDNILSGLVHVWPLSVLFDFEVKACLETLLNMVQQEGKFQKRCSPLLMKAKNRLELFKQNDEYKFDEDKNTLAELDDICGLLNSYPEEFWEAQIDNLFDELDSTSSKRVIATLNLIAEMKIDYASKYLLNKLDTADEKILCEIIITLSHIGGISEISNKKEILAKIKNSNLKAIAENIFLTAV
jgi:hypothetical protein